VAARVWMWRRGDCLDRMGCLQRAREGEGFGCKGGMGGGWLQGGSGRGRLGLEVRGPPMS
jgi:hypothetical protein